MKRIKSRPESGEQRAKKNNKKPHPFSEGDWVVHLNHGVGMIEGIEKKTVHGDKALCYRVKTENCTFWLPVENTKKGRLRALTSRSHLRRALRLLRTPPREMDPNYINRRERIRKATIDGSLLSTVRLVRDLWWRKKEQRLNQTEERALTRLTEQLVMEWSICLDVTNEEARNELQELLGGAELQAKAG